VYLEWAGLRAQIFLLFVASPWRDYMPLWQWTWSVPNIQLLSKDGIALSNVSEPGGWYRCSCVLTRLFSMVLRNPALGSLYLSVFLTSINDFFSNLLIAV
jgi:hypothetical protein